MHPRNCFITLTYDEKHLKSPKLDYRDFQLFMKKLRKTQNDPVGVFVTGEYGEKTKRKHWHAILFNWCPKDSRPKYKTQRGDQVYDSETLTKLWGHGIAEYGSVTLESAGYCARYAAKKLVHGNDGDHDYEPISRKSSKHAIGKKWLEQFFPDVFSYGRMELAGGEQTCIPRYYEKWFKKNHPDLWNHYVTRTKLQIIRAAEEREKLSQEEWVKVLHERRNNGKPNPLTRNQVKAIIIKQKFEQRLQNYLKL